MHRSFCMRWNMNTIMRCKQRHSPSPVFKMAALFDSTLNVILYSATHSIWSPFQQVNNRIVPNYSQHKTPYNNTNHHKYVPFICLRFNSNLFHSSASVMECQWLCWKLLYNIQRGKRSVSLLCGFQALACTGDLEVAGFMITANCSDSYHQSYFKHNPSRFDWYIEEAWPFPEIENITNT